MASTSPFPFMPPRSTERRMDHFDDLVYRGDSSTILYKFMDALCGDAGAGSLIKETFMARLSNSLETIYFNDLDFIFGSIQFLGRTEAEAYDYNPGKDMLTSDQWDEVRVKDAWYRDRIKKFFIAANLGGTPQGLRTAVDAAIAVDCDIFEVWRYMDNFGLGDNLGRSPSSARNEVVIRPHKTSLQPVERRLLRDMLSRILPMDTIITVDLNGLGVASPLPVRSITADSTYFEVQKTVTPTPVIADFPAPELLAIDLDPTEKWLFSKSPELAPYAAFNISQEYGYYYLVSGGARSPIDSVSYGTLQPDGTVRREPDFELFQTISKYGEWHEYETADSPDNYPGGKFGVHPSTPVAINPDGSPYVYPYESQEQYVQEKMAEVIALGGIANEFRYKLPIQKESVSKVVFTADQAIAWAPPAQESTVTSSWTYRRNPDRTVDMRNQLNMFVRTGQ